MRQWLNLVAVVIGALLLGTTLLIAVQTPVPPGDDAPPVEVTVPAVVAASPSPTPVPPFPAARAGMVLAIAEDGALRILSADGATSWPLLPDVKAVDASWSPDGRHVVVATADQQLLVTHPERGDARMLLAPDQSLAAAPLSWSDVVTVAFTLQMPEGSQAAVWSYRRGTPELLGPGGGAVGSSATGAVAWTSPDERAVMLWLPDGEPEMLVRQQALYALVARYSAGLGLVGQPEGPPLRWSPDGSKLAVPVALVPANTQTDWLVVVAEPQGETPRVWRLVSTRRLYQLEWTPGGDALLFADGLGLSIFRLATGKVERLMSDVQSFAVDHAAERVLVSTGTGLRSIDLAVDQPNSNAAEPFGAQAARYTHLDVCCAASSSDPR